MQTFRILAALSLAALAAACAQRPLEAPPTIREQPPVVVQPAKPPAGAHYKLGAPYSINGKLYEPREDYGYDATGVASWYGAGHDGKATANGERFRVTELTAAHPTLPLPSIVKVTNLRNNRSVVVRVNDRGPFIDDRLIDLSKAAAHKIGMLGQGTAQVRVQILAEPSRREAKKLIDLGRACFRC